LKSVAIGLADDLDSVCYLLNFRHQQQSSSLSLSELRPEIRRAVTVAHQAAPIVESQIRPELRRLVTAWQESGPNLAKMLEADNVLENRIKHWRALMVPTNSGNAQLLWMPNPSDFNPASPKDMALAHFMDLLINPLWYKLGGPCRRCDKYYVKKTHRQKVYCSRRCGSVTTALETNRKRRSKDHEEKLHRARTAAQEWSAIDTRLPWKQWVSRKASISIKWITRAENKREIGEPIKRRAKRAT
jgi:hypothetical protein